MGIDAYPIILFLAALCMIIGHSIYQEIRNMTQNTVTIIAIETLGSHKVLLLSDGQVQVLNEHAKVQTSLSPEEATRLYDFLLLHMAFIERRKQPLS